MDGPDQVLARLQVDAVLAADAGVDHGQERGGQLEQGQAAQRRPAAARGRGRGGAPAVARGGGAGPRAGGGGGASEGRATGAGGGGARGGARVGGDQQISLPIARRAGGQRAADGRAHPRL